MTMWACLYSRMIVTAPGWRGYCLLYYHNLYIMSMVAASGKYPPKRVKTCQKQEEAHCRPDSSRRKRCKQNSQHVTQKPERVKKHIPTVPAQLPAQMNSKAA